MPVESSATGASADAPVDLWYCRYADLDPAIVEARCLPHLSAPERELLPRYRHQGVRLQYLLTRALIREVLADYGVGAAGELEFAHNRHGRPELVPRRSDLSFNISHTERFILCAVSRHGTVGVDVEWQHRRIELGLADRYFAASEVALLESAPPDAQRELFLSFWTLKESFIKALGTGLATPLANFAFQLEEDPIRVQLADPDLGPCQRWRFARFQLEPHYVGAVAVLDAPPRPVRLRARSLLPWGPRGDWYHPPGS